mmetsp:Transcript_31060/g.81512  ORF Transcript_31060/g.81512 Transcript_31060/m.81512 type:complete len:95 (-) Transcript_31060:96-380(-)
MDAQDEAVDLYGDVRSKKRAIEEALFGVLYTLTKEKASRRAIVALFFVFVDFLQLAAFSFSSEFNWTLGNSTFFSTVVQVASMFQLQNLLQSAG